MGNALLLPQAEIAPGSGAKRHDNQYVLVVGMCGKNRLPVSTCHFGLSSIYELA
jgi:hypothetical protein